MSAALREAAQEATRKLGGKWHGSYGTAQCPAHTDNKPSLSITPGYKAVLFKCFAGCTQEAVLAAVRGEGVKTRLPQDLAARAERTGIDRRMLLALDIWDGAHPKLGDPALRYLKRRGLPDGGPARYDPMSITKEADKDGHMRKLALPALVLPLRNEFGFRAIQRIFLTPEGEKARISSPKKLLGEIDGATIRIGTPRGPRINLAEGFEDARSAMMLNDLDHCWAVCGVHNYAHVDLPPDCRRVVIYSQHGQAAHEAIERAREHLTANGRSLGIVMPPEGGDWNDAVRAMTGV